MKYPTAGDPQHPRRELLRSLIPGAPPISVTIFKAPTIDEAEKQVAGAITSKCVMLVQLHET